MTVWTACALGLSVSALGLAVYTYSLASGALRRARQELALETDSANHWAMVADGVVHDPRCGFDFTTRQAGARVCLRCECEQLRAQLTQAQQPAARWVPPGGHHPREDV